MRKLYITFFSFSFIQVVLSAQMSLACGTATATSEERRFILEEIATLAVERNDELFCIPVQPYIFSDDNHNGGLTPIELNTGLSYLNYHFRNAGIQFYWAGLPVYIANSDLFNFNMTDADANGADTENELVTLAGQSMHAVNLYFINSITKNNGNSVQGYAYYPGNSPVSNRIFMTNGAVVGADNGTMVHEFGHYFGLLHTHEGTEDGPFSAHAECVARSGAESNCFTAGDMICDTESDPIFNPAEFDYATCSYEGSATDKFGVTYQPMTGNIMSFYPDNCGGYFTNGQLERIQQGLEARLAATFYTLDSYAGTQQAPSILQASYDAATGSVHLSWENETGNALGYLVERADETDDIFVVIPGAVTTFGATTFTDIDIESGKSYAYRLKPANGSCYVYSGTASIHIPAAACVPATTEEIGLGYIDMFRIKENTNIHLLKNSAYQYNGYSDFTTEAVQINAGATLQILARAKKISDNYVPQNISIWIDLNNDLDFDDAGELMMQTTGTPSSEQISGTIQLPENMTAGLHRLRLRSRMAPESASSPCAYYESGETEDYMLEIETVAPTSTAQPANNQNGGQLIPNQQQSMTQTKMYAFPNPVINTTQVVITTGIEQEGMLVLTDVNGVSLFSRTVTLQVGENILPVEMNGLGEGIYFVSVNTPYMTHALSVFKKSDD